MKHINISKHKKIGMSLVELLLVVSLAAVILLGMFMAYSKVSETNRINDEISSIGTLVSESRIFAMSNKFKKLNNAEFRKLKVINENNTTSDGRFKSQLSAGIDMETLYDNKDKMNTHIKLSFHNFNVEYCTRFLQSIEKQVDVITVEKRILKNHFDKERIVDYNLNDTADACNALSHSYALIPLTLIFPYNK